MRPSQLQEDASPPWKRILYFMLFVQIVTTMGFSSIFPFLPLYVESLGSVSRLSTKALTGLVYTAQALTMMITSPIWGALADRWGRKPMVVRATLGGAVILVLMAFVRSAEELVFLRAVQGMITGVVGSVNALVAGMVPRERAGYAMGVMQVGLGVGIGLGPMIGGFIADLFGYDAAFFLTAALLAVAGLIVLFGVDEGFVRSETLQIRRPRFWENWGRIVSAPGVAITYTLRFAHQIGRIVYLPILPMFVLLLLDNPDRVNSVTGLAIGICSAAGAVFALVLGNLGDRMGHRRILILCTLAGTAFYMLQSQVQNDIQFLVLQFCIGIAIGGITTAISALLARITPMGEEGAVYGLDNAISAGARALGPMIGVAIAGFLGVRAVFGAIAVLYFISALLAVWGLPTEKAGSR